MVQVVVSCPSRIQDLLADSQYTFKAQKLSLAKMNANGVPIISLFSGAGGLDLGFERVGFVPSVAYDIFPSAVRTYNRNRGKTIAQVRDLSCMDAEAIITDVSEKCGDLIPVGVIGGPPCQAFSRSNVYPRDDDIRRTLPGRFAHLLKGLNDYYGLRFFVFENVRGITFKRHSEEFARFRFLFKEAGFHLFEAFVDAKDYGVPQQRPRVFIIGLNKDVFGEADYTLPKPMEEQPTTVWEAFEAAFGPPPWPEPTFYKPRLEPSDIPFHPNHWTMVPRSLRFHNGSLKEGEIKGRSFRVLSWNKPSWTVAYGHREIHVHPSGQRRLSIFEAMILQGFPTNYVLLGSLSDQVKLVSDAVPPPLAYHIAASTVASLAESRVM